MKEVNFGKIHLMLQKSVGMSVSPKLYIKISTESLSKAEAIMPYLFESQLAQNEKDSCLFNVIKLKASLILNVPASLK